MPRRLAVRLFLCALLVACRAASSAPDFEERRLVVDRIIDAALSEGRAYEMLVELCERAPHRLSGSEGAAAAVEWARETMIAQGLENVRLEPCTVPRWERGAPEELSFAGPAELAGERLPILALGGSIATPAAGVEGELVVVRSFEELAERADEVPGRIVLFARPLDDRARTTFRAYGGAVNQRSSGAIEAARYGAVAVLVRSMTTLRDDVPHTGALRYEDGVARIPAAAVSTNGCDRLVALVEEQKPVRLRLRMDCRWLDPAPSFNVVGELVGSERPDEVIVIGGHLDAWDVGHGAHDDGGGCCQSIEAVRLLKALDLRPRRTVRAVLFMNEENGLAGARAYYAEHEAEMENHVMAIESDGGVHTPRGFSTDANPAALAILERAAALLEEFGAERVERGGGGADIGPMAASGVVLVGFRADSQRYFDLHHSALDTIDKVNRREIELGAAAIASLAYLVADLPETLPRNPPKSE